MDQEKRPDISDDSLLFTPKRVGMHQIKNRLIALPVHTGFARPDGHASPWLTTFYEGLAGSGVGMVVVANTAVSLDGVVSRYNLRADTDAFIPGLSHLAAAIKKNGATACIQLNHAGRFAKTDTPLLPFPMSHSDLSFNVESLKGFMEFFPFEERFHLTREFLYKIKAWGHAMTPAEQERVIDDFAQAAFRAYQAGFDMVELHGANGYLLCQYLSSFTNKLESGPGGDFPRRCTFPLRVVQAVKKHLPPNFPVGFRILLREWVPGGIDLTEALAFARLLEKEGIAYLSASTGTFNSIFSRHAITEMGKRAYLRQDTRTLTQSVVIPTIISGRITTPSVADKLLREGTADFIGLGRPLRCDPGWVKKARAKAGTGKIRVCTNCNACLKRVILEKGFICSRWPRLYQEKSKLAHKLLTRTDKSLWLIEGPRDMSTFKQCLPLLLKDAGHGTAPLSMLFLRDAYQNQLFDTEKSSFIKWAEDVYKENDLGDATPVNVMETSREKWEETIHQVILKGSYGKIFLGSAQDRAWPKRVLYRERGKVAALLSESRFQRRILVPVDLSDATLLIMEFLKKGYMTADGFIITFVHVLTGRQEPAMQRWSGLKSIAGFGKAVPLELIHGNTDVVPALADIIHSGNHGTIIMGKRGLSGIKRWLLGSVSSGVLARLTDQSLFLID